MYFNQRNLKYAVLTTTTESLETDCITWIKEHYPRMAVHMFLRSSQTKRITSKYHTFCILRIYAEHTADIFLCWALRVAGDSGIVYCWRRVVCEYMADSLNEAGLLACSYHAGNRIAYRESAQNKWNGNECQVALFTFLL